MLRPIKHFYRTYNSHKLFILAAFVLFWPLAVYLMWRHNKWSFKVRSVTTAVLVGLTLLIGVGAYNAPPSVSLADSSITTGYKTDNDSVVLAGRVSTLHNPKLLINNKPVAVDAGGAFNYELKLPEGNTDVSIVAESQKGTDTQHFKVHRTTASEFAERKKLAEERRKAAADKAAKAKAIAKENAANAKARAAEKAAKAKAAAIAAMPVCDGTNVKSNCKVDGAVYRTYAYHPAVAAKTHQESVVTYKEEVTGYCTLCADGTYSPTCATGRGACSWHGGVAQWNAPRTSSVPVYGSKLVVDAPAKAAYYDKVLDEQFN